MHSISIDLGICTILLITYVLAHEGDVIVLGHTAVLLEIRSFVRRHGLEELVDDFIRDERVAKVKLGDIGLKACQHQSNAVMES